MKKIGLLLLLFLYFSDCAEAQFIKDRINAVAFGGAYAKQQNVNNNGHFIGTYFDCLPLRSTNGRWTFGLYGLFSESRFRDNLSRYEGSISERGGGLTSGYYREGWPDNRQCFIGLSAGLKYVENVGRQRDRYGNIYRGVQEDWLATFNANFNILSSNKMWPRSQLMVAYQTPVKTEKRAFFNGRSTASSIWNTRYLELLAKQSVINWELGNKVEIAPKVLALYSHDVGQSYFGPGGDLSLHRPHKDDFLSVYCLYKASSQAGNQEFAFGINFNFIAFFIQ